MNKTHLVKRLETLQEKSNYNEKIDFQELFDRHTQGETIPDEQFKGLPKLKEIFYQLLNGEELED